MMSIYQKIWRFDRPPASLAGLRPLSASISMAACLAVVAAAAENPGWFPFSPPEDSFTAEAAFDLRELNEKVAGEHGFIQAKGDQFVLGSSGEPIRFWAVNGPPSDIHDPAALGRVARQLAKLGVNLVRVHGGYFDENGQVDATKVRHAIEIVEAMKKEGIYTHFSIYFPLWLRPKASTAWLDGYDGSKNPFAALFFNTGFQERYREWWRALLTTPSPTTGHRLIDEPAVAGLEIQNEDSLFFWTFSEQNIPDPELRTLEGMFADWLKKKYGSLDQAFSHWNGLKVKRDSPAENRVAFRPLWNLFSEKTPRDQDTARFLFGVQRRFYSQTRDFLRTLGFRGVITASNWYTASPEVLGPLEKMSYLVGDFVDRHGYFSCNHKGNESAWSIREGHTYSDRSALRFDPEQPGKPRVFVHPVMDPNYDGKPSMISETTFTRPNRYRSEAPLYYAAYGALQGTDAIIHFAFDGARWGVKPGYWMQPWTLMSPAMMGQSPAAALIFRRGLISPGQVVAEVNLNPEDLLDLKGTPLPQDAAFDELRLKDVPQTANLKPGQRLDPLLHYVGQTTVSFKPQPTGVKGIDVRSFIDHARQTVASTGGELKLDYGRGLLIVNAPRVQALSGNLRAAGSVELADLSISSELELGHIVAVPLDNQPLATSSRILLQVMSEEKATDYQTEAAGPGVLRITNIGHDPWLVRDLEGTVGFKRADAAQLKVTALDFNGYPTDSVGSAREIKLRSATIYYLIAR